jgi:hypothetical protein
LCCMYAVARLAYVDRAAGSGASRLSAPLPKWSRSVSAQEQTAIALDKALAWARGEIRIEVPLPDGSIQELNVMQYRRECETQERLHGSRGKTSDEQSRPRDAC